MTYCRLRQICLVAHDLEAQAKALCDYFGWAIAFRDPHVAEFGLANVLMPVGEPPVFIEIVSPIAPGTTAGRYLDRRQGDGGYMYICDTSDLGSLRHRLGSIGVRTIREGVRADEPAVESMQLHPKDTGGAILEFDHHGAGADMHGPYRWAGPDWQSGWRNHPISAVLGAEIQSDNPEKLGKRWAEIFSRPLSAHSDGRSEIRIDNAFARFVPARDGRGEGLSAVHIQSTSHTTHEINLCGVRWIIHGTD
jgi:hypothetical protein